MNIKEFQELSKRTMPKVGSQVNVDGDILIMSRPLIVANYAMGLTGEAGEVTDLLKKNVFHGHALNREEVEKEIGDFMHYAVGLATLFNLDMEVILEKNIKKLKERYPNGFNQADSIMRRDMNNENKLI